MQPITRAVWDLRKRLSGEPRESSGGRLWPTLGKRACRRPEGPTEEVLRVVWVLTLRPLPLVAEDQPPHPR